MEKTYRERLEALEHIASPIGVPLQSHFRGKTDEISRTVCRKIMLVMSLLVYLYGITFLITVFFSIGLLLTKTKAIKSVTFSQTDLFFFPVFVIIGISFTELILFIASFLFIAPIVAVILTAASLLILICLVIIKLVRLSSFSVCLTRKRILLLSWIVLVSLTTFHFCRIINDMKLSPPGDLMDHNTIISSIAQNGGFPSNYLPVSDIEFEVFKYPRGFQALGVMSTVSLTGCPPIDSLIMGGLISILIPLTIFSTVYLATKSASLSFVSYLLAMILPTGGIQSPFSGNDLTLGNLVNGTYPQHLSNLQLIGILSILVYASNSNWKKMTPIYLIVSIATILSHYSHAFYVVSFSAILLLMLGRKNVMSFYKSLSNLRKGLLVLIVFLVAVLLLVGYLSARNYAFSVISRKPERQALDPLYFVSNGYGIVISLCFTISIIRCVIYRRLDLLNSFFFLISVPVFISSFFPEVYEQWLWLIMPRRSVVPLMGISISVLLINFHNMYENFRTCRSGVSISNVRITGWKGIFPTAALLLLLLAAAPNISYVPSTWGRPLDSDLRAVDWILANTKADDLVLNDITLSGIYLTSFRFQNVVNLAALSAFVFKQQPELRRSAYGKRVLECKTLFLEPFDYEYSQQIISKYDIKYMFVTSEMYYYDYYDYHYYHESDQYYRRKWNGSQSSYLDFFDNNPYLEVRFKEGNSRVYSTNLTFQDSNGIHSMNLWTHQTEIIKSEGYLGDKMILWNPDDPDNSISPGDTLELVLSAFDDNDSSHVSVYFYNEDWSWFVGRAVKNETILMTVKLPSFSEKCYFVSWYRSPRESTGTVCVKIYGLYRFEE